MSDLGFIYMIYREGLQCLFFIMLLYKAWDMYSFEEESEKY